jgi:hypothetical protein
LDLGHARAAYFCLYTFVAQIVKLRTVLITMAALLVPAEPGPPPSPFPRQDLIRALKQLEKTLGFRRTKSFSHSSCVLHF